MSCKVCDAKLQCKLDFWNGVKRKDNPYDNDAMMAESWNAEWDSLHGNSEVMADFQMMRTQQEAAKRLLEYPPLLKSTLIKQLLAVLDK